MIKVEIKNQANEITHFANFETQELANEWLANPNNIRSWGGNGNYTATQTDITSETTQKNTNKSARAYLASTDWYVIRKEETGTAIPQEILDARAAARASIAE